MRSGVEKQMSLEEYVDFFSSADFSGCTISYLNQIIHMHGFRKLHKSNKKTVGEAVDALELLDLSRSTLKQGAAESSTSSLTLEEVITDIEALKWQECCLTSLEIINSNEITRSVAKPKKKSNKRKKTTTTKKKIQRSGEANDAMTSTVKALPKKSKRNRSAIVYETAPETSTL